MEDTLALKAYEYLRKKLVRGEYAAGSKLVNRTLAKEIGISFTPVREAISQLASEGLIEYIRGAGAYVRNPDLQELKQLYDLRENMEPFVASEACANISQNELEELQEICDQWSSICHEIRHATRNESAHEHANLQQLYRWRDLEEQFQKRMLHSTRNQWLQKAAGDLQRVSHAFSPWRQEPMNLTLRLAAREWRNHSALLQALRDRNPKSAQEYVLKQIKAEREQHLSASKNGDRSLA